MNNWIIEEADLLHFRLRSKRHKKRMQYKDFHKKLLALDRESWALNRHQENLGWVELETPVMRGYKRSFVLREDVARSRQASFWEGILQKINTTQYSAKKTLR